MITYLNSSLMSMLGQHLISWIRYWLRYKKAVKIWGWSLPIYPPTILIFIFFVHPYLAVRQCTTTFKNKKGMTTITIFVLQSEIQKSGSIISFDKIIKQLFARCSAIWHVGDVYALLRDPGNLHAMHAAKWPFRFELPGFS